MRKYRILRKTDSDGVNWHFPQYRYLYFFWRHLKEVRNEPLKECVVGNMTYESAFRRIMTDIKNRKKTKFIKTEILSIYEKK